MSSKMGFWRWAFASAAVLMVCSAASARVIESKGITTDGTAAIVVYPDLEFDTARSIDTKIQLTNTADTQVSVKCFYINANGHCGGEGGPICRLDSQCAPGLFCEPGWQVTNFRLNLTKRQPLSWNLSSGLTNGLPLSNKPGPPDGQGQPQFNDGSIPPAPENPFSGELRCIELRYNEDVPSDRNDLKGESTVLREDGAMDARKSNAIGIKAIEGAQRDPVEVLNIGGPEAEYGMEADGGNPAGCPNIWTLNHFFDGAPVAHHGGMMTQNVRSVLTLTPCAADILTSKPGSATIQFLIYNEFEQRFSTSTRISCYESTPLSDIDTRPGPDGDRFSIFSVGTQGTISGMSRLRSVEGPETDGYDARGILAVLQENWGNGTCSGVGTSSANGAPKPEPARCASDADCAVGSTCDSVDTLPYFTTEANVQFQGRRNQGDQMVIPLP